jgi:hypothetical protein
MIALVVNTVNQYEYTLDDVGMFRNLWEVQFYNKIYKQLLWIAKSILFAIPNIFGYKVQPINSDLATVCDFWRNMVLGRSSDAHSHLLE